VAVCDRLRVTCIAERPVHSESREIQSAFEWVGGRRRRPAGSGCAACKKNGRRQGKNRPAKDKGSRTRTDNRAEQRVTRPAVCRSAIRTRVSSRVPVDAEGREWLNIAQLQQKTRVEAVLASSWRRWRAARDSSGVRVRSLEAVKSISNRHEGPRRRPHAGWRTRESRSEKGQGHGLPWTR